MSRFPAPSLPAALAQRLPAALALTLLAALGCARPPAKTAAVTTPTARVAAGEQAAARAAELVDHLALLATGALPSAETRGSLATAIAERPALVEGYVDELLARPDLARAVAPSVVLPSLATGKHVQYGQYTLKSQAVDGGTLYYLRAPCDPAKAARVHPWWALKETVLVCPEDYRPKNLRHPDGWYCGAGPEWPFARLPEYCGCGPNLVLCARDAAQQHALKESARNEVNDTVSYLVEHDRPLSDIFADPGSFRDELAEFLYQRARVVRGELTALPEISWPAGGQYAPRHEAFPGQQAGVLTTPHLVWSNDAARMRLSAYYRMLFCEHQDSVNVHPDQVLGLGVTNVRDGEGWQQLAAMPICTNCHARLDYGMQFFPGYVATREANNVLTPPGAGQGHGKYYGDDIRDLRGEGPLTPHAFAELSVGQREFATCMAERVVDHVFNDRAYTADKQAVLASYRETGRFRAMMRVALLRYAQRWMIGSGSTASPGSAPKEASAAGASMDQVSIGSTLRRLMDERCVECHDEKDLDLRSSTLPRPLVHKALDQVAFGGMPKGSGLDPPERRAMVAALVGALWPENAARATALRYFGGGLHALPIHDPRSILNAVRGQAGLVPDPQGSLRVDPLYETQAPGDEREYGPGIATFVALSALRSCKEAGHTGVALDRCIARATAPNLVINAPLR